jgi:hypothetical protein
MPSNGDPPHRQATRSGPGCMPLASRPHVPLRAQTMAASLLQKSVNRRIVTWEDIFTQPVGNALWLAIFPAGRGVSDACVNRGDNFRCCAGQGMSLEERATWNQLLMPGVLHITRRVSC